MPVPPEKTYRYASVYPIFDIFRSEWLAVRTDYSTETMRHMARGRMVPSKRFINSCVRATSWKATELFGKDFKKYDEGRDALDMG